MVQLIKFNNSLEFNLGISEEVENICQNMFRRYSLNYFAYLSFRIDGSILRLSNHKAWTKQYFENELYNENSFYIDHWKRVSLGGSKKFLWVSQPQSKIHQGWRKNNIGNGFSIYKRKGNLLETCSFGTYLENYKANDLYVKYSIDFENFISFFKKKAAHLLRLDRPSHVIKPNKRIFLNGLNETDLLINEKKIELFLNKIKMN